jgi:hypothetical protein
MRWRVVSCSLTSAIAALLIAGPAVAQTVSKAPRLFLGRSAPVRTIDPAARPFQSASWEVQARRPELRIPISDRMEFVASGAKEKSPGESFGRRADGPAGRSRNPRTARVGLVMRW